MQNVDIKNLQVCLNKLISTTDPSKSQQTVTQLNGFTKLFTRFSQNKTSVIDWNKIEKLPEEAVKDYDCLDSPTNCTVHQMLNKLVIVKLNGGLGTSMGCSGPKSMIIVKDGKNFLELTLEQIDNLNKAYKVDVPLVLMNSFNTDTETENILNKKGISNVHTFNQSCYPRISKETLMPVAEVGNVEESMESWYPPGHGDFYESFKNSGLLEKFIKEGKTYCYVSNIDNLGATVDFKILNFLLNPNQPRHFHEFVMEVTEKTKADIKGGTLINYEGKINLLELAQVPDDHINDFKSIKMFKYFNTNNIWVKLDSIDRNMKQDLLELEIIVNHKSLKNGRKVIQLETAIGAGMKYFENSIGINVPRSRFLPVKKSSDLVLIMSNVYNLNNGSLVMSPKRMFPNTPLIMLGDKHFKNVSDCLSRFSSIPDFLELDTLTVCGDIIFGKNVSLKGIVIILANGTDQINIPDGSVIENTIVSGNLTMIDL
ncbi:UTP--glucose-1-phosphate uridylyltransferase-like [Diorhabda carinulata]|uniref:UTP--glucose-1-phosphate uridylyltransferase-like n=1 Tax=Diorhabda carinulata TaxID=1163345 RepID=UPI0025A1340D|nr:UTP--glucose-1-phosphate uridylyltransferase-like [Diorhabda carinulata]